VIVVYEEDRKTLLKIAGMKFEFENLKIRFHKCQVSFLVVKTVKCKRDINFTCVPLLFIIRYIYEFFYLLTFFYSYLS